MLQINTSLNLNALDPPLPELLRHLFKRGMVGGEVVAREAIYNR